MDLNRGSGKILRNCGNFGTADWNITLMQGIKRAGRPKGGKSKGAFVSFRGKMYAIGKSGNVDMVECSEQTSEEYSNIDCAPMYGSGCTYDEIEHRPDHEESFDIDPFWTIGDDSYSTSFWEGDFYSGANYGY